MPVSGPTNSPVTPANTGTPTSPPTSPTTPPSPSVPVPPVVSDGFEAAASLRQKKAAEKALGVLGHATGRVDGRFSDVTRDAIATFQRARGLAATGELDRRTYTDLRAVEKLKNKGVQAAGLLSSGTKKVEQRLRRLGYDVGAVDGLYTQQTADAVKAFKKDQRIAQGNLDDGRLGEAGRTLLKKETNALAHAPYRARVKNTRAHRRADGAAERAAEGNGIRLGDSSPAVATIQRHLRSAGFDPKRTNGVFDERTEGMVKVFQQKSGLEPTGVVNARTWRKLRGAQMEANGPTSPTQRKGEKSSAVKKTEKMLKQLGFNPGAVDGLYDAKTQKALDRFRSSYDLSGRGQGVGRTTLSKLRAASKSHISTSELVRIMPGLSRARAASMVPHLNSAMVEFGITTKKRQAAFLAQVGHESLSLKFFEEIASGAAYEGRADLGNVRPGDGVRYKGRGPIQLTGRANYRSVGRALGLPLERHPTMAARKSVGFRTAAYFWASRGLNGLADRGAFDSITRTINGGTNGAEDRRNRWAIAKRVLNV